MPLRLLCVLATLLLSATTLVAQSSVWKVTRGNHTLYLGGTIHMLRLSDFPLPAEFTSAFQKSARIVFETDISKLHSLEVQAAVAARGFLTDGTTLQSHLSPAAWKAAAAHCAQAQLPLEQLQRMKPWLFSLTISIVELQKMGVASEGVDMYFYKQAVEAGKPLDQLETIQQQLEFIASLGAGHESELVLKSIEDLASLPRIMDGVLAAWRSGNVDKIDELMLRDWTTKYPAILKGLLTDRNAAWLPKLEAFLESPEIEFVLVGAGHLPGREGLLALLKARGCKLEQIKAPAAPRAKS